MSSNHILRIGLCTDTHYWPRELPRDFGQDGSAQLLEASGLLQDILIDELQGAALDLVIHLGDQTCGGGTFNLPPPHFQNSVEHCYRKFHELRSQVYALPGNHDCPSGGGDWSYFEKRWGLKPHLGMTIDLPMARLILLNLQGHSAKQIRQAKPYDTVYGWVHDRELERLEEALATAGKRPVILFSHQLLQPWSGPQKWRKFYGTRNGDAVLELLTRYGNVRAVFQGHAHRLDVHTTMLGRSETTFAVLPSIVEYPVAWTCLELSAQNLRMIHRPLPVSELAQQSRTIIGVEGLQDWRAGRPDWQDKTIALY